MSQFNKAKTIDLTQEARFPYSWKNKTNIALIMRLKIKKIKGNMYLIHSMRKLMIKIYEIENLSIRGKIDLDLDQINLQLDNSIWVSLLIKNCQII